MIHNDPKRSLEIGAWLICAASAGFAGSLLVVGGVSIDVFSLGTPLLLFAFLVGAYIFYRWWRADPAISDICGAFAVITLSGAAAGIISLAGLRLGAPLIDGNLAAFDSALGLDTRSMVIAAANTPDFAGLMGLAYLSSFPILLASVVLLGWTRHVRPLWQLAFIFAFTAVGCATLSVFFPAAGAFSHFAYPAEVLEGLPSGAGVFHLAKFEYYRRAVAPTISMSSLQGVVTFPSFHCCLALMTAFAYVEHRWLFLISFLWNGLVIVSTIPIGGHYIVDLPAGAALWGLAWGLATALWREPREKSGSYPASETPSGLDKNWQRQPDR
jgi:hypothetical protein